MLSKKEKDKLAELAKKLGKRPRTVLEKLLENGSISTYELGQLGYDQPPRAAQDLKEAGVRLITKQGKHPKSGSRMGIYHLHPEQPLLTGRFTGRKAFPKAFREKVYAYFNNKCNICNVEYDTTMLQIDHRIPYIVAGEIKQLRVQDFQPLCGSHQRTKSWVCEHCRNRERRLKRVCRTCYWAFPDKGYRHIATVPERRLDVTWKGPSELRLYTQLRRLCTKEAVDLQTMIKIIIGQYLDRETKP